MPWKRFEGSGSSIKYIGNLLAGYGMLICGGITDDMFILVTITSSKSTYER